MKHNKRTSIIVANYNNGKYLNAFIDSIINNSKTPDECIIVDDGSSDDSVEILQSYSDLPFLKVIAFPENRGFYAALNEALDHASGDYIMRADPDDILHPDRIKIQFEFMEANPEIDVLGSDIQYFLDSLDQPINLSNIPEKHEDIFRMFKNGENAILHPTVCMKAEVHKKFRYQKLFPEDYEIYSRIILQGYQFYNMKRCLHYLRVHSKSSTSQLKLNQIVQTFKFRDELFGTKSSYLKIRTYYLHLRWYRNYQLNHQRPTKYVWLFLSAILYPSKVFKRIFR